MAAQMAANFLEGEAIRQTVVMLCCDREKGALNVCIPLHRVAQCEMWQPLVRGKPAAVPSWCEQECTHQSSTSVCNLSQ